MTLCCCQIVNSNNISLWAISSFYLQIEMGFQETKTPGSAREKTDNSKSFCWYIKLKRFLIMFWTHKFAKWPMDNQKSWFLQLLNQKISKTTNNLPVMFRCWQCPTSVWFSINSHFLIHIIILQLELVDTNLDTYL